MNGNREQGNNFLLDGMDINDAIGNNVGYNPSPDALAEIRVGTGNHSAEFGNSSGATVSMTLKSGTNEIHGNVFEFFRNSALDATDFFVNRSGGQKPGFGRNLFGGTLGGPIVKDKAFFFVDYQGTRQRQSGSTTATVIPAANAASTGPDGTIYFIGALEVRPEPGKPVEAGGKIGGSYYRLALLIYRPRS